MNEASDAEIHWVNWKMAPLALMIIAGGVYGGYLIHHRGLLQESVAIRWQPPSERIAREDGRPGDGQDDRQDDRQDDSVPRTLTAGAPPPAGQTESPTTGPGSGVDAGVERTAVDAGDRNRVIEPPDAPAMTTTGRESVTVAADDAPAVTASGTAPPAIRPRAPADGVEKTVRKTNHETLVASWNTLTRELADAVDGSAGERVRQLVADGADVNASDIRGETPLIKAAWNSDAAMVATLLDLGADVFLATNDGRTALYTGVVSGNAEVVRRLLQAGAPPNAMTDFGKTPLMASAWIDHPDIAAELLRFGAEPNQRDSRGRGALFYALWDSNVDVARILAANGARLDASDYLGQTAADIARLRRIDLDDVVNGNSGLN